MGKRINLEKVHTAISTKDESLLILVDNKDMLILDMRTGNLDPKYGYVIQTMHHFDKVNI